MYSLTSGRPKARRDPKDRRRRARFRLRQGAGRRCACGAQRRREEARQEEGGARDDEREGDQKARRIGEEA